MFRIFPILLVVLALLMPEPSIAQSTSSRRASAKPTPIPVATPIPRKRSFFERLFGRRPKATPVPAEPTPSPKVRTARSVKATPTRTTSRTSRRKPSTTAEKPAATETSAEPSTSTPAATPAPKPAARKTASKPAATTPARTPEPSTAGTTDPEELDRQKYDAAKAKAMEDPEIQALKKKADEAVSDDEAIKAQRAYNKALFAKMRKLDPLIKERIDQMEAALMKKLGSQPGAR